MAHLTFQLSEASTNFDVTDIVVTGGTLSNFAGSGTHYTADFTPQIQSTTAATVDVAGGTFTDAAGNGNTAAPQSIMMVDTVSAATWSITKQRIRHRRQRGELHGAPGRHAAGERDSDHSSGDHQYHHHQRRLCELRGGGDYGDHWARPI